MNTEREGPLTRAELSVLQTRRLTALLDTVLPANAFYARKFAAAALSRQDIRTPSDLRRVPFTTKAELTANQEAYPPYGDCLSYPLERYCRLHQTSGTSGAPLRWLDDPQSWQGMLDSWREIFRIVGVTAKDRLFFPFSFGPFLGFWTAFEAATQLGCLSLPAGGVSSLARLRMLVDNRATVMLCTPTYALHLAQLARDEGFAGKTTLRALIVAGEPGGSIPATRACIEKGWNARLFDHSGMTETGPIAIECADNPGGLHILEADYLAQVIDPASGAEVDPGELGELVVTTLGRLGSPLLRYRTGDLVRLDPKPCACGLPYVRLEGGILGRTDEMVPIRGNNFFPGALEGVIRRFAEVAEYRVEVDGSAALVQLRVEVEPVSDAPPGLGERIAHAIRDELFFRPEVVVVAPGTLPRFEMKARRVSRKGR